VLLLIIVTKLKKLVESEARMEVNVTILDGYVDEPTCLGVPPYISTYVRYIAGALVASGIHPENIHYVTIDSYRRKECAKTLVKESDVLFLVAGLTVPGRYLGGTPITLKEVEEIASLPAYKVIGGPVKFGFTMRGGTRALKPAFSGFDLVCEGDIELSAFYIGTAVLKGKSLPAGTFTLKRSPEDIAEFAPAGAFIVKQHPYYPHVMCEVETYRGCERKHHCSFCTEGLYGNPQTRTVDSILKEVKSLHRFGVKHFRIGRQPNILGYMAKSGKGEFPEPNAKAICELFEGIRSLGDIKTLHIDNVNPGTISAHPLASKKALECIATYNTEGDVAPLGLESADEAVVRLNSLKAKPEDVMKAVEIINQVGAYKERENGLHKLLPGINILVGLPGETKGTFEKNRAFLESILERGLLLRRINIRQVMVFEGTAIAGMTRRAKTKHRREFERFRRWVRENIDMPMMKKVFPTGTVIKDVLTESYDGNHTMGRQIATYPLLVRIPARLPLFKKVDVVVVGHRERSTLGVPLPLKVNEMSHKLLSCLPGVSRKMASEIILRKPFKSAEEFLRHFPGMRNLVKYMEFL